MSDILGVVLAGGRSSRMGTDKSSLMWGEQSLLAHQVETLKDLGLSTLVSGPEHIADQQEGYFGPLAGVQTVVQQSESALGWLFIPVDMPLLNSELLTPLLQQQQSCCYQDHWMPFLLWNHHQLPSQVNQLMAAADARQRYLKALLNQQSVVTLVANQNQQQRLVNANNPEQWQALIQQQSNSTVKMQAG